MTKNKQIAASDNVTERTSEKSDVRGAQPHFRRESVCGRVRRLCFCPWQVLRAHSLMLDGFLAKEPTLRSNFAALSLSTASGPFFCESSFTPITFRQASKSSCVSFGLMVPFEKRT